MKTYSDILTLLRNSGDHNKLHVAVIFSKGYYEWFPVDKVGYMQQLALIEPQAAKVTPFPCYLEVEEDGEMFIHPNVENG